jgi:hypothetical protein
MLPGLVCYACLPASAIFPPPPRSTNGPMPRARSTTPIRRRRNSAPARSGRRRAHPARWWPGRPALRTGARREGQPGHAVHHHAIGTAPAATRAGFCCARAASPTPKKPSTPTRTRNSCAASTGKLELPLLVVGSRKLAGFQDAAWQEALSAAAYPRSAQLPPATSLQRRNRPQACRRRPRARKKAPPPDEASAQAAEQQPRHPAKKSGNAPPGFQF